MKKILFFILIFLNLVPGLKNHKLALSGPQKVFAIGGEDDGGEDDDWWDDDDDDWGENPGGGGNGDGGGTGDGGTLDPVEIIGTPPDPGGGGEPWPDPDPDPEIPDPWDDDEDLNDPDDDVQNFNSTDPTNIIPANKFESFLQLAKAAGVVVQPQYSTSIVVNGVTYNGAVTELWQNINGEWKLVGCYFFPDTNTTVFPSGSYYNIGTDNSGEPIVTNDPDLYPPYIPGNSPGYNVDPGVGGNPGGGDPGGGNDFQISAADQQLIWDIQQEDMDEDDIVNDHPNCYGTGRTGNVRFQGTAEHWLIQFDYVNTVPGGLREYSIPGAGPAGGRGYADIANTLTNEFFEIKPNTGNNLALGAAEVANYVIKANINCPPAAGLWTTGSNYPSAGKVFPHPKQPGKVLFAMLTAPGVIQYEVRELTNSPQPIPVLMPQSLLDKLKNFVRLVSTNTANLEEQIVIFLRKNPELIPYLKTAAVGIVIATIVEDIATSGVGIADDWASFTIARTLWRLASVM